MERNSEYSEYKVKLIEQIKPLLETGHTSNEIAAQLKIGTQYAKELVELIISNNGVIILPPVEPPKPSVVLTQDQEEIILHAWNVDKVETIKELTQRVFGGDYDGRTNEARAIKRFLASRQLKARGTHEYGPKKKDSFALSVTQTEFIRNHANLLSPIEIAQSLFSNPNLSPLSTEARAVRSYMEDITPGIVKEAKTASYLRDVTEVYRSPKTINETVNRVNAYVGDKLEVSKLTPRQKQNLQCLMYYLSVHRFQMAMNEFVDERDREMMESSFIRWLYDKGDLTEEEVDLYINWVLDVVNHQKMYRELNKLILFRDNALEEKGVISKPLVDQINKLYEEIDANQKRQKTAQNDLSGKRRDRVESAGRNNQSVVQLIECFKDHKKRQLMIDFAESRKKAVKTEMDRLDTMDELKFELFGATKEELLHGL
jgi:hypothetical protein